MTGRGSCLSSHHSHHVNYTMVFYDAQTTCYHCVKFFVRTVNIIEKIECKYLTCKFCHHIMFNQVYFYQLDAKHFETSLLL